MLHFNLSHPVEMLWFGEFVAPEKGFQHLSRQLFEYELMVVTEGELFIADERQEYRVPAGEYFVMLPTRFQHGTRLCRCRFFWLHFRADTRPPLNFSLPEQGRFTDGEAISALAARLFRAEAAEHRGTLSHYLATEFLLELARQQRTEPPPGDPRTHDELLCDRVRGFIAWHRFSEVRVGDIARELGYHEKYLSAVFRRTEGITLKRYLIGERLQEAKRLLLDSDYNISEIANYLNFENAHNFSRFFKTETGLSPTAFRERGHAEGETTSPGGG